LAAAESFAMMRPTPEVFSSIEILNPNSFVTEDTELRHRGHGAFRGSQNRLATEVKGSAEL
jgi:hypothetical protein